MHVFMGCVHINAGAHKGISFPLKLALQAVVNCLTWVLRIKLGSFERALPAPNHWTISLVHGHFLVLLMVYEDYCSKCLLCNVHMSFSLDIQCLAI